MSRTWALLQTIIVVGILFYAGWKANDLYARPGDRLTCERDYTGTCAEPEPPKDPCGGKR